jgi:hypothetical protein
MRGFVGFAAFSRSLGENKEKGVLKEPLMDPAPVNIEKDEAVSGLHVISIPQKL